MSSSPWERHSEWLSCRDGEKWTDWIREESLEWADALPTKNQKLSQVSQCEAEINRLHETPVTDIGQIKLAYLGLAAVCLAAIGELDREGKQ